MRTYVLTQPSSEPVSASDVKLAARVDDTRFDALLPGLIASARSVAEQETGLRLMQQVVRVELPDFPGDQVVLPVAGATAVAVTYWSGGQWVALAVGDLAWWAAGVGTSIAPALNVTWPQLDSIAGDAPRVRVDITAGQASAANVPAGIRTYITALVIQLLDNPSQTAASAAESNPLLGRLLDPYRLWAHQ